MAHFPSERIRTQQRFGFGPRFGKTDTLSLAAQLSAQGFQAKALQALPNTDAYITQLHTLNAQKREAKGDAHKLKAMRKAINKHGDEAFRNQQHARHQQVVETPVDFQERLIHFWSNHFSVAGDKRPVKPICGAIENEVIRAHWAGNFADMLLAVTQHPAMLLYLDNHRSIGPNSTMGKRQKRGLNENLAREILELHTVGVNGPYQQNDVIEFAKALSGWRVSFSAKNPGFQYVGRAHEPGAVTVLGKRYAQRGKQQAEAILADLAMREETARFLASKLTQYFLGETKPEVVQPVAKAYIDSKGQLSAMYQALIRLPKASDSNECRFRDPQQWCYAAVRSAGVSFSSKALTNAMRNMGQEPFMATSPAGFPDVDMPYNSPVGLRQRWMVANQFAQTVVKSFDKKAAKQRIAHLTEQVYGADLDEHYQVVANKTQHSATQLALFWLSPQFQYR